MASLRNISIILPDLRSGGAERVNLDLARGFTERGINVEFVLRQNQGELLDEARNIGSVFSLNAKRVRAAIKPLAAYLGQKRPDAVLASMWPLTTVAVRAREISGHHCPVVLAEHGVLSRQYATWGFFHNLSLRLSMRYATSRADGVACVSSGVADDLTKLSGRPRDTFSVIHNPVPAPNPVNAVERSNADALWGGGHGKRIITVGRLKAVKNQALLIDALALMNDSQARLMIVGDGELRGELEQHARDRDVADQVIFAGFQANPAAFYETSDVFALSSWSEGFGNVIVEAMGHGLPVVSTNCPTGPREVLDEGRFGQLIEPGDANAFAEALVQALLSPADPDRQKMRAAQFLPDVAVDRYLRLLVPDGAEPLDKAG